MAALHVLQGPFGCNAVHVALHPAAQCAVVFFPGDRIQAAAMPQPVARLQDPQHIARLLATKFPAPHVYIVMPSRYEACFACFDHFLPKVTLSGEPLGYRGGGLRATQQLSSLLRGAGWAPGLPVHLVGFSKGGTVLNQILAEVGELGSGDSAGEQPGPQPPPQPPPPPPLLQGCLSLAAALHQVHFVDAGLNCRGAHLTDPEAVQRLGGWCRQHPQLRLLLHGTPRQWDDPRRPWVPLEKNRFLQMCREAGVPAAQLKYYEGQRGSLEMHFRVLDDFVVAGESGGTEPE